MNTPITLTTDQTARRAHLRQASDANRAAWQRFTKHPHTCADEEAQERINAVAPFTNEERSELERLDFVAEVPALYTCYVKGNSYDLTKINEWRLSEITTWTGETLGRVVWQGRPFSGAFGDTRINFRALGINGVTYSGTCYGGPGCLCRLRAVKA